MKLINRKIGSVFMSLCMVTTLLLPAQVAIANNSQNCKPKTQVKNVILMIADGAGFNTVKATDYYQYGKAGEQVYQKWPVRKAVSTYEYEYIYDYTYGVDGKINGYAITDYEILGYDSNEYWSNFNYGKYIDPNLPTQGAYLNNSTDSASSATAMATGVKTKDGSIGVDIDGIPQTNIIQIAESRGKATGVVSTVPFSHATAAGFVAHNINRNDYAVIANEMIFNSAVDVIIGCSAPDYGFNGETPYPGSTKYAGGAATWADIIDDFSVTGADANSDGTADKWAVIRDKAEFEALATGDTPARLLGIPKVYQTLQYYRTPIYSQADAGVDPITPNLPNLSDMTKAAINVLDNDEDGFFLMVEGGAIDWASHFNQKGRMIEETIDFNNAVEAVVAWVELNSNWDETLVIVTADHETGYIWGPGSNPKFKSVKNNGAGNMPGFEYYGDIGGFNWHTNSLVPFYAKGHGIAKAMIDYVANEKDKNYGYYLDNTEIFNVLRFLMNN